MQIKEFSVKKVLTILLVVWVLNWVFLYVPTLSVRAAGIVLQTQNLQAEPVLQAAPVLQVSTQLNGALAVESQALLNLIGNMNEPVYDEWGRQIAGPAQ